MQRRGIAKHSETIKTVFECKTFFPGSLFWATSLKLIRASKLKVFQQDLLQFSGHFVKLFCPVSVKKKFVTISDTKRFWAAATAKSLSESIWSTLKLIDKPLKLIDLSWWTGGGTRWVFSKVKVNRSNEFVPCLCRDFFPLLSPKKLTHRTYLFFKSYWVLKKLIKPGFEPVTFWLVSSSKA